MSGEDSSESVEQRLLTDSKECRGVGKNDSEIDAAYSGAAPAANRFFISFSAQGVRIAFLEKQVESTKFHFRSGVLLHPSDAVELKTVLASMLKDFEESQQKTQEVGQKEVEK